MTEPMEPSRPAPGSNSGDSTWHLSQQSLGWRVFEITAIAVAVAVIASILWFAIDVLLLLFAAILLATVLRAPTELIARAGVPQRLALALVVIAVLGGLVALGWALAPRVNAQVPQLADSLAAAIRQFQRDWGFDQWTALFPKGMDLRSLLPSPAGLIGGATGIISSTFGVIANVVILFVVGVYLAANPVLYVEGAARLVPPSKRARVHATLHALGQTLRWWLIGQLVSMTAVGLLTYVVLTILGVPLALLLAVIAFLLTFVPFLGPILSAVPVLLVAFSQGVEVGVSALVLYTLIQSFEGYALSPLVQRRAVALPPALTISAQVLLGVLVGGMGIALATPLAAAGMVATRMLYLEAVLGEPAEPPIPGPPKDRGNPAAPKRQGDI